MMPKTGKPIALTSADYELLKRAAEYLYRYFAAAHQQAKVEEEKGRSGKSGEREAAKPATPRAAAG